MKKKRTIRILSSNEADEGNVNKKKKKKSEEKRKIRNRRQYIRCDNFIVINCSIVYHFFSSKTGDNLEQSEERTDSVLFFFLNGTALVGLCPVV